LKKHILFHPHRDQEIHTAYCASSSVLLYTLQALHIQSKKPSSSEQSKLPEM